MVSKVVKMRRKRVPGRVKEVNRVEKIYQLALLGCSDEEIADFFGVPCEYFQGWCERSGVLSDALKRGRRGADGDVAKSLYKMSTGFYYKEEVAVFDKETKEFHKTWVKKFCKPDGNLIKFWMSCRHKSWAEAPKELGGGGLVPVLTIRDRVSVEEAEVVEAEGSEQGGDGK
jgi:hypothetical protein